MATTEERVDKLETRFTTLEQQVATVATKVDMVIGEIQQQREDMRRLQDRQDAAQAKHDADKRKVEFYALDAKFDGLIQQIKYTRDKTIIGFGIMALAMAAIVIAALK